METKTAIEEIKPNFIPLQPDFQPADLARLIIQTNLFVLKGANGQSAEAQRRLQFLDLLQNPNSQKLVLATRQRNLDLLKYGPDSTQGQQALQELVLLKRTKDVSIGKLPGKTITYEAMLATTLPERRILLKPVIMSVFEAVKPISETLQQNPEAVLDEDQEIKRYFSLHSSKYIAQLKALNDQIGKPMSEKCRVTVCIPAFHEEKNIYRALESYLNQTGITKDSFEVIVLVNHRTDKKADDTELEVRKFQRDHPELKIHCVYAVFPPEKAVMGNIRKISQDLGLLRGMERQQKIGSLLIASNDADSYGLRAGAFKRLIEEFDTNRPLDLIVGKFTYPEEAFQRFPVLRAIFMIDKVHRRATEALIKKSKKDYIPTPFSTGFLSYYRAAAYAAIGGYNSSIVRGSDVNIGNRIIDARKNVKSHAIYSNALKIKIDPRRALSKMVSGLHWINEWDDVSGWQEDPFVRGKTWQDFYDESISTFNNQRFASELNAWYQRRRAQHKRRNEGLSNAYITKIMAPGIQRTFGLLGIKGRVTDSTIIVDEASRFQESLIRKTEAAVEPEPVLIPRQEEIRLSSPILQELKSNPEAVLDDRKEITRYLNLHSKEYLEQLTALNKQIGKPMFSDCGLVISIPAYKAEGSIYRTLLQYAKQKELEPKTYEIHVVVDSKPSNSHSNQLMWLEVQRFKQNFPHIPVHYVHACFGGIKPSIGWVRKVGTDMALLRAKQRSVWQAPHFVIGMNDADCWGIRESGIKTIMDMVVAKYDYPDEALRKFPLLHAFILFERIQRMERSRELKKRGYEPITPWGTGICTFMRSGIYAAVGGFDYRHFEHEDSVLGRKIKGTRKYPSRHVFWSNAARYKTDPRRPLNAMITGAHWVNQWGLGEKDLHDPRVAGKSWQDFHDPHTEVLSRKRLEEELNALAEFQIRSSYKNNRDKFIWAAKSSFERTMQQLGIKGRFLADGRIIIEDISDLDEKMRRFRFDYLKSPAEIKLLIGYLSSYQSSFPPESEEAATLRKDLLYLQKKLSEIKK